MGIGYTTRGFEDGLPHLWHNGGDLVSLLFQVLEHGEDGDAIDSVGAL